MSAAAKFRYTVARCTVHSIAVGMGDHVDIVGDPENAAYEWLIRSPQGVRCHSDVAYGSPEVALRDGLSAYLGQTEQPADAADREPGKGGRSAVDVDSALGAERARGGLAGGPVASSADEGRTMSPRNDKEARDSLQFSSLFSDLAREVPDQKARDALLFVIRTACRLDDQVGMLTRIGQAYVDTEWGEDCGSNLLALDLLMLLKHIRDAVSEATDIVSLEADEVARGLVRLAALGADPAPPRPLPDAPGAEA